MNQGEEGITIKKRRFRLISVSRPDSSLPVQRTLRESRLKTTTNRWQKSRCRRKRKGTGRISWRRRCHRRMK
ncbi:hypothetical protein MUK42_10390 [Musa troglodytarum]|uniref:Uncharacterized protein n=1 Tax=Musa troglodytarum TaxID=320322 RepID=A0A9E7JEE2_9LILI|nr:hypothetical protein MUK42_08817 [Musa troglodytarum]URD83181.1 hypothetical protein MUK42_10390 [Musa troglodytarum]